jgi:hypothetical protein
MRTTNSSTGRAAKFLKSKETRTRKDIQLEFGVTTEEDTNNGKLSILIKPRVHKLRDSTKSMDSMSTDHSTLSQNSHSAECSSAIITTTSGPEDGETMLRHNNSSSTVSQRPSRATTGNSTLLKSKETVDQPMLE